MLFSRDLLFCVLRAKSGVGQQLTGPKVNGPKVVKTAGQKSTGPKVVSVVVNHLQLQSERQVSNELVDDLLGGTPHD